MILVAGIVGLAACSDATSPTQNSTAGPTLKMTTLTSVTTVVSPSNMSGWYFWNDKNDTFAGSPGELVVGPAPTPLGTGSVRLGPLTDNGATAAGYSVIATNAYAGTPLAQITSLSYATFQPGPTLAIALQFDVRYRTTDVSYGGRLVFEPYQTVGTVGSGWQTWSPLSGKWWASKTTAAGSNWSGFDGNADALSIGANGNTTTYDFEGTAALGACEVSVTNSTITLQSNCNTAVTLAIPQGFTLEGNGYTVTAINPASGSFLGAIIKAGGTSAIVNNVTIATAGLTGCQDGVTGLRGILFEGAGGSITNNTIRDINRGPSGCQEGNGIDVTNYPGITQFTVVVTGNTVTNYQKTGIRANGNVAATINSNVVTGLGPVSYIAQNGIQISRTATASVKNNTVSGNFYTGPDWVSCGLLFYQAGGVKASANNLFSNQVNQCNAGKGGGKYASI